MVKNRRMVEDFIFRDDTNQTKASMSLSIIVLPKAELRYYIDPVEVDKIVASAKKNGIIEPLLVRPLPNSDKYEVVAGAKRYRAAHILELLEVPVVIRSLSDEDALEIALIENFARSGLTDLEEADGVLRLLSAKLKISLQEVPPLLHHIQNQQRGRNAANNVIGNDVIEIVQDCLISLGNIKLDSFISNRLPLLNLPNEILEVLRLGKLETSKAKAIARLRDEELRKQMLEDAIAYDLSLSEIKRKIQEIEQQYEPDSTPSLKDRVDDTWRRFKKSKLWDNPKKQSKVEKLLSQIEALINEE